MTEKLKALFKEYGRIAIYTYFAIYALTLAGFVVAIWLGVEVKGAGGKAGVLAAAWFAGRLTLPLRIAATAALTPVLAKLLRRKDRQATETDTSR